jgi:PAS domain S-box-containing protein
MANRGLVERLRADPAGAGREPPRGRQRYLPWLPVPLLLGAVLVARAAGLRDLYENETLRLVLSFTFYTLVSLGTLFLVGRSFLATGAPGMLLMECGVVLWSLAGTVGDAVSHGDQNTNVTIFNTGILLAGVCLLAGAVLSLRPQGALRAKGLWLGAGFALALVALLLVAWGAQARWLPIFFIPGSGGTTVRYCVLISAIVMLVLSAALLHAGQRAARTPFTSWYSLALLLLAVGLSGIMIQRRLWDVVNWLSRTAQWLGGFYLLLAAIAALRESKLPLLPSGEKSRPALYRAAMAVVAVLVAAAVRLVFLQALGMRAAFITFYPAVMIAALYGGWRSGLLATVLSALAADYFWMEPAGQFGIAQPADWLSLVIFLLSGAMIAWVTEALLRARARASAAEAQALLAAQREAAAEEIRESRAKLEAALASMTDAVFISDAQGRFIEFNDAFATYHRFKSKSECAKTFAQYPDILDVFLADGTLAPLDMWAVPRALRGETASNAEYTLRRKDTGETWVGSYSFAPIRGKNGAITGSVVVGRDITERKRAQEALWRQREWLQVTLTSIGDAVLSTDLAGKITFLNPVAESLTGWKEPEAQGRPAREVFRIINEQTRQQGDDIVAHVLRDGITVALANHTAIQARDGREIPIEDSAAPIKDVAGNVTGVVLVFHDVTQKRRAQEALAESRERLDLALSSARMATFDWDIVTNKRIWSDGVHRLLGTRPEAFTGAAEEFFKIIHPEDRSTVQAALAKAVDTRAAYETEYRAVWPDGSIRHIAARGMLHRDDAGRPVQMTGVCWDITDRKVAEGALRQSVEELKRSNQELEQFAYIASHDLQEPLRQVRAFVQMLRDRYGDKLDDKAAQYFQFVYDGAARMSDLVRGLLDYSRVGGRDAPRQSTPCRHALDTALANLQATIAESHALIMQDELPTVVAEPTQLTQLFQNLIGNAIKFHPDGVPPRIHVGCRPEEGHWLFWVQDNGIGIAPEFHEKIFLIFQRLHTREKYPGTGIGLAICKKIVEQHGGRIWIESQAGKGSTFFFTVPKGNVR